MTPQLPTRGQAIAAGSLIVAFATAARAGFAEAIKGPAYYFLDPSSLADRRDVVGDALDGWLRFSSDGRVEASTSKVELGTGLRTALAQIVADELDVPFASVSIVQGDSRGPDQGGTFGSYSVQFAGAQLRLAAAEARGVIVRLAAEHFGVEPAAIVTSGGRASIAARPARSITYGELLGTKALSRTITGRYAPKDPRRYAIVGRSQRRVDIPDKVFGRFTYIHDLRVPGMVYGAMILPPRYGAHVVSIDESSVRGLPGNPRVVHDNDFVGVVADSERASIAAREALAVTWSDGVSAATSGAQLYDEWRTASPLAETQAFAYGDVAGALATATKSLAAEYAWPYNIHGMIGPSCAVADIGEQLGTVYCGSQQTGAAAYLIAQMLGMKPGSVRVEYVEAAGSYGRLNNDDAAFDAAVLSKRVGKPVRVLWSRRDEHRISVKSPAMLFTAKAGIAGAAPTALDFTITTPTHVDFSSRAAQVVTGAKPSPPVLLVSPVTDAYRFGNRAVRTRWLAPSFRRDASMRTLGALATTFALESFVDEIALATGFDPLEFRLRYLTDERALDTLRAVADLASWTPRTRTSSSSSSSRARGRGLAYACYEGATHAAVVAEIEVDRASGRIDVERFFVAQDCGLAINPDGVRNQLEGGVLQAASRTLYEEVQWGEHDVTSVDWATYPIMRITQAPDVRAVLVNNVPGAKPMGAGEAAGSPVSAAIANALADAIGVRVQTAPLTPERVLAALRERA